MRNIVLPVVLALSLLLSGCGVAVPTAPAKESSRSFFAMDTYMSLRADGAEEALLDEAVAWVEDLESKISTTREDSEVFALNRDGVGRLSQEPAALLRRALALCEQTGGALDVTVYPVVRAWGFTTGAYRVPEAAELEALLRSVDYRRVTLTEDGQVRLSPGMELDLGSVAKGYVGDRLCALLRAGGVESALLDLGGNVQALGGKPEGGDWRVGVRDPSGEGLLGVLSVRDSAVVTSGGYERYFTDEAGRLWWHIMDPATGYPAQNGLISVSVVGGEGLVCDALSTALFVMGPSRAADYWRTHSGFDMILVTEDGELLLTPDLADRFTPSEGSAYTLRLIDREAGAAA